MKNYIMRLQDKYISDEDVSSLLFTYAVFKAKSCKKLAKRLANDLKFQACLYGIILEDYELRYFRSMNMFVLRLIFNRNNKYTIVTYNIKNVINL